VLHYRFAHAASGLLISSEPSYIITTITYCSTEQQCLNNSISEPYLSLSSLRYKFNRFYIECRPCICVDI